jgi:tetratricopeptide (TPR) repeat protein
MWIIWILLGLFLIVLILYLINKKSNKPGASSVIERNKLEKMLEKELTPESVLKEEEEKGDFRYKDDYNKNIARAGDQDQLKQESEQKLKEGIKKLRTKDLDGAELEFSRLIEFDNANAAAYYYRGLIKNEKKDYLNAVSDFDLAFAYGFKEADLHLQRGISNLHLKLYDKASAEFNTLIALNPDNIEAHYNKGLAEAALKDYPSAMSEFSRVIELNPDHGSAYYERGKIYLQMNDKDSACKDFQEAHTRGIIPAQNYLKTLCNKPEAGS